MTEVRKWHVLLIYRQMIPSVRLCGHCQMEELDRQGIVEYRACQEMNLKSIDLNWADLVLLGRLDSWYEYQLTKKLKVAGKYLIYIIDDDLLNIPQEISSAEYYGQREIQSNIRKMIEMSDAIMSPSPILLEKYATNGRKAIQIEEPAIDPVIYRLHDPANPVKIGFAGSIDRTSDVENLLRETVVLIKQEFGNKVEFEFFGASPSFTQEIGAKCIPYCESYEEYRKVLNSLEWDIGLAPMPNTPFHACKHYNKFIEYAAAGILGVFSRVKPYIFLENAEIDLVYCENTTESWKQNLRKLIMNRDYLNEKRKETSAYVTHMHSIEKCSRDLHELMHEVILNKWKKAEYIPINGIFIYKLVEKIRYIIYVLRRYKTGILAKIFEKLKYMHK